MHEQSRRALLGRLFPAGVPRLWCPTLTHFAAAHKLDRDRIRRHLQALAPHVRGILAPGSTGEGWDMSDADTRELLDIVLSEASKLGIRVLIGVLKTKTDEMLACMDAMLAALAARHPQSVDPIDALIHASAAGFTVCPPKGRDLDQAHLEEALSRVLNRGAPIALYQLPQMTENELAPQTVARLAHAFPNFFLFKDTSGGDRVALDSSDYAGVVLVRGAEGDYSRWTKATGSPYDGFLLSTANAFAPQLAEMLALLDQGRHADADAISNRVSLVVQRTFAMVQGFPSGNPFANANKILDHIMAFGSMATEVAPPLLYHGQRLPGGWIEPTMAALEQQQLLPRKGYMSK